MHEHPWGAWSWKLDFVREVQNLPGVEVRRGDQCPFGLASVDNAGEGLALKPTGWMSNCTPVLDEVARRCPNNYCAKSEHHRHVDLIGGKRAKMAERYPVKLIKAILRGLRKHLMGGTERMYLAELEIGSTVVNLRTFTKLMSG